MLTIIQTHVISSPVQQEKFYIGTQYVSDGIYKRVAISEHGYVSEAEGNSLVEIVAGIESLEEVVFVSFVQCDENLEIEEFLTELEAERK